MNPAEIETRLLAIIERAEYAGRQRGISKATRSSKRAAAAAEMADISDRQADRMARDLVRDLTPGLHDEAFLTGGKVPAHVPGAYPTLSCCGGSIQLVTQTCCGDSITVEATKGNDQ